MGLTWSKFEIWDWGGRREEGEGRREGERGEEAGAAGGEGGDNEEEEEE